MEQELRPINGKVLYTPKGAASEYGRIGANFYTGCPHGCTYCYLKRGITAGTLGGTDVRLKRTLVDEDTAMDTFRKELWKNIEVCRRYGVFLSFTTDPLIAETREMTFCAVRECRNKDVPVWVLTKNADFVDDENFMAYFKVLTPILRRGIHFGFTLTGRDDMEPNASSNNWRIGAMEKMHGLGYPTFASVEPVIDFDASARVIRESIGYCDEYRIGLRSGVKSNYYSRDVLIEWVIWAVGFITAKGRNVYLKESVRRFLLGKCPSQEMYDAIMSKCLTN